MDDAYPHELERIALLGDGTRVRIRPIRSDDAPRLIELYDRLSHHTAYQRFFTVMRRLPPDWATILARVDYQRRLALVAEHDTPTGAQLLGVGRYEPAGHDSAEVAFVVQDGWQGKGLGTALVRDLLRAATARGVRRFVAHVLADNRRMLGLLARHGRIVERRVEAGVATIVFTSPGADARGPASGERPR